MLRFTTVLSLIILLTLPVSAECAKSYEKADKRALEAPASAEKSVSSLSKYLTKGLKDDESKARAIFRWIAANIEYDAYGLKTGHYGDPSPEGVLKSRKGVCEGYASLFHALASEAGLEVVAIAGYSKGYGYSAGQRLGGGTNHKWNAVRLDGKWRLIDSTWGAGYLDDSMKFNRRLIEHYFLSPPEEFIFTHFPEDSSWQLLDPPVTRREFQDMVYLRPDFFANGLRLLSHTSGTIKAAGQLDVSFQGQPDTVISAKLIKNNVKLGENLTFTQREGEKLTVSALLPERGNYRLRVYAKKASDEDALSWVLDYGVVSTGDMSADAAFPAIYSKFHSTGSHLYSPLRQHLGLGSAHDFRIRVPNAYKVALLNAEKWLYLDRSGDTFSGKLIPETIGDAMLCAFFSGSSRCDGLLMYKVVPD
jgi:transglutaminase/protease-like cytokinesis protein 3